MSSNILKAKSPILGKHLLKLIDYSPAQVKYILDLAIEFKKMKKAGKIFRPYVGKNVACIFQKTSTRTRSAFETAAFDFGMGCTFIDPTSSQFGKKESIEDSAKVFSKFYDAIEYRGFEQSDIELFAKNSQDPVYNGLSNEFHPTQALCDALTILEVFKTFKNIKVCFVGACGNNTASSLAAVCALTGMEFVGIGPKSAWPKQEYIDTLNKFCKLTKGKVSYSDNKMEAVKNANVIYNDVWVDLGQPLEYFDKQFALMKDFQVDMKTLNAAAKNCIYMHCLPAFHDLNTTIAQEVVAKYGKKYPMFAKGEFEVTDEVFRSKKSVVFDQAVNRHYIVKALFYGTLKR